MKEKKSEEKQTPAQEKEHMRRQTEAHNRHLESLKADKAKVESTQTLSAETERPEVTHVGGGEEKPKGKRKRGAA